MLYVQLHSYRCQNTLIWSKRFINVQSDICKNNHEAVDYSYSSTVDNQVWKFCSEIDRCNISVCLFVCHKTSTLPYTKHVWKCAKSFLLESYNVLGRSDWCKPIHINMSQPQNIFHAWMIWSCLNKSRQHAKSKYF